MTKRSIKVDSHIFRPGLVFSYDDSLGESETYTVLSIGHTVGEACVAMTLEHAVSELNPKFQSIYYSTSFCKLWDVGRIRILKLPSNGFLKALKKFKEINP